MKSLPSWGFQAVQVPDNESREKENVWEGCGEEKKRQSNLKGEKKNQKKELVLKDKPK